MSQTKKTAQSTAELMLELEQIVGWFEQDEVDVDVALKKFERGVAVARELKTRLKDVENKVVEIQASFSSDSGNEG